MTIYIFIMVIMYKDFIMLPRIARSEARKGYEAS